MGRARWQAGIYYVRFTFYVNATAIATLASPELTVLS